MIETLKRLSAQRLRTKISSTQPQASKSSSAEVPDAAFLTTSLPVSDDARRDEILLVSNSQNPVKDDKVGPGDPTREDTEVAVKSTIGTTMEVAPTTS